MDCRDLSGALERAAKSYVTNRRLASHLPVEAAEIAFYAMNEGLPPDIVETRAYLSRARRTQVSRLDLDYTGMGRAISAMSETARWEFQKRIERELAMMRRRGRTGDARYDLNRHAALARMLAAFDVKNESGNASGA